MEFGIPPRHEEVAGFPLGKMPPPLRADGNLSYPQFITLVRNLWSEVHPDIAFRPVESKKYSKYPVIVYSLLSRSPVTNESKKKLREVLYTEEGLGNRLVFGQRFNNVISFTVITENDPELAEAIIETFEQFMQEYTEVFKRLGVSEFLYARRLPDDEVTRPDEDIVKRAVTYMVTLERVLIQEVEVIKEIVVKARTMLVNYWQGMEYWVFDEEDDEISQFLYSDGHPFHVGDLIKLLPPGQWQDETANGDSDFFIPKSTPEGLFTDYLYQIYRIEGPQIYLQYINGGPVTIRSKGMGRLTGVEDAGAFVRAEYIDEFQSATPSY